jgi:secretion/DNA translocation related CpaE-like protein
MNGARPLLVSGDADLIDDVLRLAAANGVEVHLAPDPEGARGHWPLAPLVLVGADAGGVVSAARLPRRRDVVLVSRQPTSEDWQRAVELGAEHVVCLPDAERWLIDRLADSGEGTPRDGAIVAVVGAGGGAGASTFATTLALAAATRSLRVLLVDADPVSGGLDVLLGIEDATGVRWPDLADTRGRLSAASLEQALPHVGGVAVLSTGRDGAATIQPDAMGAVLDAGNRGFDLVVVDVPRRLDAAVETVLARADETLLVSANRVRSTAAAARLLSVLQVRCSSVGLILRTDAKGVSDEAVRSALDLPIVARVPHAPGLAARADDGEPPSLRDAYGRACVAALREMASTLARVA